MKIAKVRQFSKNDLIDKLRNVTMLKNPLIKAYEKASISIETIDTNYIVPSQYYVLNKELEDKLELKYELMKFGIDLFNIEGYVEFELRGEEITRTLLPPIVEESIECNGAIIPLLNDGMHRTYLARMEGRKIAIVYIRGVPKDIPYYAFPIQSGWNGVEKINCLTEGYIKKFHRIKDNKKLYRNFDSVFSNCSKPRINTLKN